MEGCGASCSKLFLFFINVCIFLIGAASLAVGIWCAVDQSSFLEIINTAGYLTPTNLQGVQNMPSMIEVAYIVLIGIGGFTLFVGFAGFMGACKESKCLLWIYAFFVLVCFLFLLGAGILGAMFNSQIDTNVAQFMMSTLNYSFDGQVNTTNPQSGAWYAAMQYFQCCGFNGPSDFTLNYAIYAYNWSSTYRSYCWPGGSPCESGLKVLVPTSCCMYSDGQYWNPSEMLDYDCPQNPSNMTSYTQGCKQVVENWLTNNSVVIFAVAFALAGFMAIAMVAACCMIQAMDSDI